MTTKAVPAWMKPVGKLKEKYSGAASGELACCAALFNEVYGEDGLTPGLGAHAFFYLFRRFGPPTEGSDPHKDLCSYLLHTPDPSVLLSVYPCGSGVGLAYLASHSVTTAFNKPYSDWEKKFERWYCKQGHEQTPDAYWKARMDQKVIREAVKAIGEHPGRKAAKTWDVGGWRQGSAVMRRVNKALIAAMKELMRPVYVRDVPYTLLGPSTEPFTGQVAPVYEHAGVGCITNPKAIEKRKAAK